MAELAVVTGTTPSAWASEDPAMIATVLDVLARHAEAVRHS